VFLRGKAVAYCIANLAISVASLEADLVACIVCIEKEGSDP
jgi:hypothetical protein